MKTLSICIPTYKRPDYLLRCIESAILSAEHHPIEIVVADDSMDHTNQVVLKSFENRCDFLRWHRNPFNLGIDDNIQNAINLSRSDYAWLIGEDDVFLPGAIARMHAHIQEADASFIFSNYVYVDESPSHVLGVALSEGDDAFVSRDFFLKENLWAAGFIGSVVVRCSDWALTDPAPYVGTYFTHVGRIAEMLEKTNFVQVMRSPCVANRVEGQNTFTWKMDSYGVFFGFVSMCNIVGKRFPELASIMQKSYKGFERRYRWMSLRLAIRLRSEHAFDYSQYIKYINHSSLSNLKKLAFFCISVTPSFLFKPFVWLYRNLLRFS